MKKGIILFSLVVVAVAIYFFFFMPTKKSKIAVGEMPTDTITEKVLVKGEKLDYKINQEHKVVKAIVADQRYSKENIVARIIKLSPLDGQDMAVKSMLEQLQNNPGVDEEVYERLEEVVNKHFDSKKIEERISGALNEQMSREDLAEVLAWKETPIAVRMGQLGKQTMDPEYIEMMKGELEQFKWEDLSEERRTLLEQFDNATGGTRHTISNMVLVQMTMMETISEKRGIPLDDPEQKEELEVGFRSSLEQSLVPQAHAAAGMIYKNVSNSDLQMAITAEGSESSQQFNNIVQREIQNVSRDFAREFASEISQIESP